MSAAEPTPPSDTSTPGIIAQQYAWPRVWPNETYQASTVDLSRLRAIDAFDLGHLLDSPENRRLFTQTYGKAFTDTVDVITLFQGHQDDSRGTERAYSIVDRRKRNAVGWVVLRPWTDGMRAVSWFLFLSAEVRLEKGSEVNAMFLRHAFEDLGLDFADFRTGSLELRKGYGVAFTVLDVFRSQMIVKEESQESDKYLVRRKDWPAIKRGMNAWLEAQKAETSGYKT